MRASMQLTNRASTVFSWLVEQEAHLHRGLQLMVLRRALRGAYGSFAAGSRELCESLFDAHFVETRVAPLVAEALERGARPSPEAVAEAWFASCKAPDATLAGAELEPVRAAARALLAHLEDELAAAVRGAALAPGAPAAESDGEAAALFAEAVRADSHLELDWLWLYTKMTGSFERDYCLRKALHINPASALARRELAACEAGSLKPRFIPLVER